jgi:pyruvate formate lyase activating enzyme
MENKLHSLVFNIQRFSTHDGEGIRTIIFYKGCPLRCQWCSNPESQSFEPSILYDPKKCKGFGDCIEKDPVGIKKNGSGLNINRSISDPDKIRNACVAKAMNVVGEYKGTADLLHEINKDISFYNQSKGGVTLSGGEPLAQGLELIDFLAELKIRDIDVSVETSLHIRWDSVERCFGMVNTFLVDLKHIDKEKFGLYTGGDLDLVLVNLKKLTDSGENIIIRIPVIPEFNHSENEMFGIIDFVSGLKTIKEIHFIPYHSLGIGKYEMLGMNYAFGEKKPVDPQELTAYINYAISKGFKTKTGG